MKIQNLGRKAVAFLLACVLCLTCAPEALAASDEVQAQAKVMQLMQTEGTVSVSNSVKKNLTLLKNMRLYNGYHVNTDEASYAWINLDDEKLVKMDAVSEISVRKNKKKLDVLLDSGNLFFNVTKPLEDDEILTIRTSTMAIGIRGTCGWVVVEDQRIVRVHVLEGTVSCTVTDPVTGDTKTELVSGGQTAVCTVFDGNGGETCSIDILSFSEEDVSGFVLAEVVGDSGMCDKIFDDSGIDLRNLDANAKLKQDEANVHAELADIQNNAKQQNNQVNHADLGTAGTTATTTPVTGIQTRPSTPSTPAETVSLTMPQSAAEVNTQLALANVREVVLKAAVARGGDMNTLEVDSRLTVPAGKTLTLESGVSMAVLDGQTAQINGNLTVGGSLVSNGNLSPVQGAVIRAKTFQLNVPVKDWAVSEKADNSGYYTLTYTPAPAAYTVTFHANGGSVTPASAKTGTDGKLVSLPTPTRTGYTFNGWFTASTNGAKITANTVFKADTVIYAQWSADTYTVTFDANGGSGTPASAQTGTDGKLVSLPTPTRTGYTFNGWFTAATNGSKVTENTVFKADTVIYAQWTQDEQIVDGNGWSYATVSKVLRIQGSGPMPNYDPDTNPPPWNDYLGKAESAVVTGFTTIGDNAFNGGINLKSITLPDGITSIGEAAFGMCANLTGITIPDSVEEIGEAAFGMCGSLTSVKIPEGVEIISPYTFLECGGLTSVTIPQSVIGIRRSAFEDCGKLTDVYYAGTQAQWNGIAIDDTKDGNEPLLNATIHCAGGTQDVDWRYDAATKTLHVWGNGRMGNDFYEYHQPVPWEAHLQDIESVVIDNGITDIGNDSFHDCSRLSNITIPNSVESIGTNAFDGCRSLRSINIPSSVTRFDGHAFANCTSLTSITVPEGVLSIGAYIFEGCTALTSVNLPESLVSIGEYAFSGCSGLTSLTIPSQVSCIAVYTFSNSSLTSINIPESVIIMGKGAFTDCNLTDVYYSGTQAQWNSIRFEDDNDDLFAANIHYNSPRSRSARSANYTDIPAGASYAAAAEYCRDNGLMNGTSATEFSPDGRLTRAMMVTVLHRLAGTPETSATASFADVPAGQWYTNAVNWANGEGIVLGYPDGSFGVNDPVTHEQVGLIFQRYSGAADSSIPTDKNPATRAEIAVILMNYAKGGQSETLEIGELSVFSAMNIMCGPSGIAADSDGALIVTDVNNKRVWRVVDRASAAYAGKETVEDLYGRPLGGYHDAAMAAGYFREPWGVAPFADGWAVTDAGNNVVRLIRDGKIETLGGVNLSHPTGIAAGPDGSIYVSDTFNGAVRQISAAGKVTTAATKLNDPTGLCYQNGTLYIAETGANRIVKLTDGKVTVVAGSGEDGDSDGQADKASFSVPQGVAVDTNGAIYVADTGNGTIRKIQGGNVTTIASGAQMENGLVSPAGLLAQNGRLYICDEFARKVFVLRLN